MANDNVADELLQALAKEVVKIKRIYDGSSRVITQYEAVANAVDGQKCLRTDYTYVSTTTNIDAMKESLDVWQAAWDI
jgi:hypothetical protein